MKSTVFHLTLTAEQLDAVCEGLGARLDCIDAAPQLYSPGDRAMVDALLLQLIAVRYPRR